LSNRFSTVNKAECKFSL